jgi:hypothetical protein
MRYGSLGRALLERPRSSGVAPAASVVGEPCVAARPGAWVAVSTNASVIPFAGASLSEEARLPAEVLASLRPGPVYLRIFRASDGEALETLVWEKR